MRILLDHNTPAPLRYRMFAFCGGNPLKTRRWILTLVTT